jgi:tRNA modification GTPase
VTPPEGETLVACLTPPGQSAVAVLALAGPRAWDVVRPLFRTRAGSALPGPPEPGKFRLGRLGGDAGDEVVLCVKRLSPTPYLEIHCHGGRAVVRLLLALLTQGGATACDWRDFLRRTDADPLRAAAAAALAAAPTVRTAAILLDQYHGALAAALDAITAALDRGDDAAAAAGLAELNRRAAVGRRLTAPWRVAVVGAPNVGKSSLVNALAGYRRSVVAATPGTTRDVTTTRLAVDGWPVELADTAGVRDAAEALEAAGVAQARAAAASADLRLWVLDASAPPVWPDAAAGALRLVVNKTDLPPSWDLSEAKDAVHVSARTGEGLEALCAALSGWLVPEPPPAGSAVPFTAGLANSITKAERLSASGLRDEARRIIALLRGNDGPAQSETIHKVP